MFRIARFTFLCAACAVVPGLAQNQAPDVKDVLETHNSIEIPGGALGPGTYVLKLGAEPVEANVARALSRVDVFDRSGSKLIARVYAVPQYLPPNPKATFTFYEAAPGHTKALNTWFPTGLDHGKQLVYPDEQAARIAGGSKQGVFSIPADVMYAGTREESGQPAAEKTAVARAPGAEARAAEPEAPRHPLRELPQSGSLLPVAIWVGIVALAAALLLRRYRSDPDAELSGRLISRNAALTRELAAARYRIANLARLRGPDAGR